MEDVKRTHEEGVVEVRPVKLEHEDLKKWIAGLNPKQRAVAFEEINQIRQIVKHLGYPTAIDVNRGENENDYEAFIEANPNLYHERDWYYYFFSKLPFLMEKNTTAEQRKMFYTQFLAALKGVKDDGPVVEALVRD